jgi:GNAT superfamily N-acetyltransferase
MAAPNLSIEIKLNQTPTKAQLKSLYSANNWSSAKKIDQLYLALQNSHYLVLAYHQEQLIGLANAISDGHLVVYFPHLLVHPDYQKLGIGSRLTDVLLERYKDFHQKMLVADDKAVAFYKKKGFALAQNTSAMWIYEGGDH